MDICHLKNLELEPKFQRYKGRAVLRGDIVKDDSGSSNHPEHLQLTKLCSNAGLAKTEEKGQHFTTLDDTELDRLKGSCREYTLPRSDQSSHVRGWIRGNTKIGPVLDVTFCCHQGRYGVEIMIESLFGDKTCSWVRIVNGITKYTSTGNLCSRFFWRGLITSCSYSFWRQQPLGIVFRRLYLHFILWSGTRKLYFKGVRMFQASACGELTR